MMDNLNRKAYDCSVCTLPIYDQMILKIRDTYYHGVCMNCSLCRTKIVDECYTRDGYLYCRKDFFE